jgi:hypothetical protein
MSQALLNQILNHLPALDLSELQHLNQVIKDYICRQENNAKPADFHQALVDSGMVRQIKRPSQERKTKRQLVQVKGEPISQTIVDERR